MGSKSTRSYTAFRKLCLSVITIDAEGSRLVHMNNKEVPNDIFYRNKFVEVTFGRVSITNTFSSVHFLLKDHNSSHKYDVYFESFGLRRTFDESIFTFLLCLNRHANSPSSSTFSSHARQVYASAPRARMLVSAFGRMPTHGDCIVVRNLTT